MLNKEYHNGLRAKNITKTVNFTSFNLKTTFKKGLNHGKETFLQKYTKALKYAASAHCKSTANPTLVISKCGQSTAYMYLIFGLTNLLNGSWFLMTNLQPPFSKQITLRVQ